MKRTDEQEEALAYFRLGENLRLEAGAGVGKTTMLRIMGEATRRVGQYTAFNKAPVLDAALVMPRNVATATTHSLAFRQTGKRYAHRLRAPRMRSAELARRLDMPHLTLRVGGVEAKVLQPGFLASLVMRAVTNFCFTADPVLTAAHVPYVVGIDLPDHDGRPGFENNERVRRHVEPMLATAWADVSNEAGELPFKHDHYMKIWQLSERPRIPGEFILLDEAQDTAPVLLDVVCRQDAQLVAVGDSQQAIYGWRGAVNALAQVPATATSYLTKSWRFGAAIAEVANMILGELEAELRLTGCDVDSVVGPIDGVPDAVLTRSNAQAVTTVLSYQRDGVPVHLVGGGEEVASFARGAKQLQEEKWSSHPDLTCFRTWSEVQEYVGQDPQGNELKLLVNLVDEFTVDVILKALDNQQTEEAAQVVVSTAHRAKGREWDRVQLADDFQEPEDRDEEWRLLYVAATRARSVLDLRRCEPLARLTGVEERDPVVVPPDLGARYAAAMFAPATLTAEDEAKVAELLAPEARLDALVEHFDH